jgi:hypothetical protein
MFANNIAVIIMAKNILTRRNFVQTGTVVMAGTVVSMPASKAPAGSMIRDADIRRSGRRMEYHSPGLPNLMISAMRLGCTLNLHSQRLGKVLFLRYREPIPNIVYELIDLGDETLCTSFY